MNGTVRERSAGQGSADDTAAQPRRRRRLVWLLAPIALLLLVQSVTFTFPIRARLVNAQTGEPLADTEVVAVWELDAATTVLNYYAQFLQARKRMENWVGRRPP